MNEEDLTVSLPEKIGIRKTNAKPLTWPKIELPKTPKLPELPSGSMREQIRGIGMGAKPKPEGLLYDTKLYDGFGTMADQVTKTRQYQRDFAAASAAVINQIGQTTRTLREPIAPTMSRLTTITPMIFSQTSTKQWQPTTLDLRATNIMASLNSIQPITKQKVEVITPSATPTKTETITEILNTPMPPLLTPMGLIPPGLIIPPIPTFKPPSMLLPTGFAEGGGTAFKFFKPSKPAKKGYIPDILGLMTKKALKKLPKAGVMGYGLFGRPATQLPKTKNLFKGKGRSKPKWLSVPRFLTR